jgi:hypothetical protein
MRSLLGRRHRSFARGVVNNIMLGNNIAGNQLSISGFAGSDLARNILRTADSNADSVDILTIGDSNIGFNEYGYAGGIYKAMQPLCSEYATGILPSALSGGSASFTGTILGDGLTLSYISNNEASASGSGAQIKLLVTEAGTNSTAAQITTALGMNLSLLPSVLGDAKTYQGVYLDSDINTTTKIWTSAANKNCIIFGASGCPMNVANASMQSRIVHGKFSTGSGSFKHITWPTVNSSSSVLTSGGPSVTTSTWPFTAPASGSYRVGWDGFSQGASFYPTGPIAVILQSVIRLSTKGFAHTNVMRDPGKTTTQLADRIEAMDKLLDEYLRESRDRQIAAGGSGNVVVATCSGINGTETASSFIANTQRIVDRVRLRWAAIGGDMNKLAFIVIPTHPVTTVINQWLTDRAAIVSAANAWAATQPGVCVHDIAVPYPGATILANGWYDAGGQAHLTQTGYSTISANCINTLVA